MRDQLVVGVGRDGGHALAVAADRRQPRVGGDGPLEPLGRARAEPRGVVAPQHDADRQTLAERDAPAPARVEAPDQHLAGHVVPGEVLEVGEVRDVLARPEVSADVQRASPEPGAPRGVHDEVGLPAAERRGGGQRFGRQAELAPLVGDRLQARVGDDVLDARRDGACEHRVVESAGAGCCRRRGTRPARSARRRS